MSALACSECFNKTRFPNIIYLGTVLVIALALFGIIWSIQQRHWFGESWTRPKIPKMKMMGFQVFRKWTRKVTYQKWSRIMPQNCWAILFWKIQKIAPAPNPHLFLDFPDFLQKSCFFQPIISLLGLATYLALMIDTVAGPCHEMGGSGPGLGWSDLSLVGLKNEGPNIEEGGTNKQQLSNKYATHKTCSPPNAAA